VSDTWFYVDGDNGEVGPLTFEEPCASKGPSSRPIPPLTCSSYMAGKLVFARFVWTSRFASRDMSQDDPGQTRRFGSSGRN
jgi:hypothetical protein